VVGGSSGATQSGESSGGSASASGGRSTSGGSSTSAGVSMLCFRDGGAAASCTKFGSKCGCDADCCSGECKLGSCVQAVGGSCLSSPDCGSLDCSDEACVCAKSTNGECIVDADCCDMVQCVVTLVPDAGYSGLCCNGPGGSCAAGEGCCNSECSNGMCQCIAPAALSCSSDNVCCSGRCLINRTGITCLNEPGELCSHNDECETQRCQDGGCSYCSGSLGPCMDQAACCSGLVCAPFFEGAVSIPDSGDCCIPSGSPCETDRSGCCSGTCLDAGMCGCAGVGSSCINDQSCCPGASCSFDGGLGACCQSTGSTCFLPSECCGGDCTDGGVCR